MHRVRFIRVPAMTRWKIVKLYNKNDGSKEFIEKNFFFSTNINMCHGSGQHLSQVYYLST
ncbi:hypothetical protein Mapa_000019 [Marchantia paleacea]|nr:hypothetical protein Mapa_000019 [Marchantia paleacea]